MDKYSKENTIYLSSTGKSLSFEEHPQDISFLVGGEKVLELKTNGDILVKGKLVENDKEVVTGLRYFLAGHGVYNSPIR